MKKILSIVAMSLIALSSLVSCTKATPESVAGTYNYAACDVEYSPSTPETDAYVSVLKVSAQKSFQGSIITINADNTATINLGGANIPTTYTLTPKGEITFIFGAEITGLPISSFKGNISGNDLNIVIDAKEYEDAAEEIKKLGFDVCKVKVTFKK